MISQVNGYNLKPEWFIGKGSFGSVYKAEKGGQFYAIKIFQSELLQTQYRDRIDREIKSIQKIRHPNVVKLHDFGTFKENEFEYFYIVMDLVEGQTLSNFVGTLEEDRCVEIIESVLSTINHIHSKGIIHRDLKPDNIFIDKHGKPIILDFGLAKLIDYSSITQTGERVGTYYYMSPEQVTDSKNIDNRSDYFAVGVIFYQLVTGALPYDAVNLPALIDQIKNQYPQNPSEINPAVSNRTENIILKLLEKEPYKRYQNISEVVNDINQKVDKEKGRLNINSEFFVRLLHTEKEIFNSAIKDGIIDRVIFPANFFERYHPTVKILKESGVPFTTDPATNRLTYTAFSKTAGVQELPYSSGSEVMPIQKKDFSSIYQVQNYVKKVLDFQIENGVTELAAPFFYAKNSGDEWFGINLKLLKESVEYRNSNLSSYPIWAGICMNVENWHEEDEKNKILNSYMRTSPDGFFVYGDPICNQSNVTQLFHYTDFLRKLQDFSGIPVIASRVNGFGLVLVSLGVAGFCSGVAALDSFRESILSDSQDGYGPDPRYYIPQLLGTVTMKKGITTKLTDIASSSLGSELSCDCQYCTGISSGALTLKNMKLHFLKKRKEEMLELLSLAPQDRLPYIKNKIDIASKYVKTLANEGIVVGDFSHLKAWQSLLAQFNS